MPSLTNGALNQWSNVSNKGDWYSMRIRDQIISEVSAETRKFILTIETMMQILPLLGLLGTVVGMIKVFDVMTFFGTGNATFNGKRSVSSHNTYNGWLGRRYFWTIYCKFIEKKGRR